MKKRNRKALVAAGMAMAVMLSGCGSNSGQAQNQTAAQEAQTQQAASGNAGNEAAKETAGNPGDGGTIKLGGLYDRTGDFALVGVQKYNAAQLAISEINEAGGLLGKQIEFVAPDTQSDNTRYQEMARKLILEDKVVAIHGAMSSASREAIRPIMEENKMLYFYNNQYEGGVASHYTFCTGAVPEQQVVPMMKDMIEKYGNKYYFIGADYNVGYGTFAWAEFIGNGLGAECVGKEFVPLSVSQYASSIDKIKAANPDFVIVHLTGVTQSSFFGQWNASGSDLPPLCSTFLMVQGYEHKRFDPPALAGTFVTTAYTEELETPEAKEFTEKMYKMFPDMEYVGMEAESEYTGIYLWADAVKRCGTTDVETVIAEMEKGITLEGMPCGKVVLLGDSHQCVKDIWSMHCDENHNLVADTCYPQSVPFWLSEVMGVDLRKEAPNVELSLDEMPADAKMPEM